LAYGFELDGEDIPSATQSVSAVQVGSRLNAAAFCAISELNRTGEGRGRRYRGRQAPIFSVGW